MAPVISADRTVSLLRNVATARPEQLLAAETLIRETASAGLPVAAGEPYPAGTPGPPAGALGFVVGPGQEAHDLTAQRPAWARGQRAPTLPGRFTDALGFPLIVQSISPATLTILVCAGQVVGYFSGSVVVFPLSPIVPLQLAEFGAGTLWLVARMIDPAAPGDALAGLPITFGLIEAPDITLSGGTLTLPGGPLTVGVAPPGPPAPGVTGDAAAAQVGAPSQATVLIGAGSIGVTLNGEASADIYGLHVRATAPGAGSPRYVAALNTLALPLALAAPPAFAPTGALSTLFAPEGTATITAAEWALLVTHAPPGALAEAEGPGGMLLTLADGLSARIEGEVAPTALASWQVLVGPQAIVILAMRSAARAQQKLPLWTEGAGATATIDSPTGALVSYLDSAAGESLRFAAALALVASPPVTTDGEGLSIPSAHGFVALGHITAGLELIVLAAPDPPPPDGPGVFESFPFAIDNALLRCLWPELVIIGAVLSGGDVIAAGLDVALPLASLLPTLPDPYASSHEQPISGQEPLGTASAIVLARNGQITVSFAFSPPQSDALRVAAARLGGVELLDVSTKADLAGVQLGVRGLELLDIQELDLRLPEPGLSVMTVPHISWEPLLGADPSVLVSQNDGPQTQIFVVTQTPRPAGGGFVMVPAEPAPALDHVVAAAASGSASLSAQFNLPFGLRGFIAAEPDGAVLPDVSYVQPAFAESAGGRQVSIRASGYPDTVGMSGRARTTSDASAPGTIDPGDYGASVLGNTAGGIANFFLTDFATGPSLPVNRIDLSGYGASLFSHWHGELDVKDPCDVGVDDVKFDVMIGRTNYEFVEVRSWLFPWCVPVVRTLTIARNLAGVDVRTLSDWRASDDSRFEILVADGTNLPLLGPVARITSVRNIHETGEPLVVVNAPLSYARVTFDADILIDPDLTITKGAVPDVPSRIAAFGLVGYIQVGGNPCIKDGAQAVERATLTDLIQLVLEEGAARGFVSCAGAVRGSGLQFAFSGVELGAAQTALVGALRGKPVLPADGAWSLARRASTSKAPEAIDPKTSVPLIRGGAAGTTWTIAEPADALRAAPIGQPGGPALGYGVLQDTGTQKVYFEQPTLAPGTQDVSFKNSPQLADAGALLGAAGVFPDIGALIAAAERTLKADAAGLGYTSTGKLPASFDRPLLSAGPVTVLLRYRGTKKDGSAGDPSSYTVTIQPAQPRYAITIGPVSLSLTVDGLAGPNDPLLTVTGTLSASDGSAPGLHDVDIVYGSALGLVTDLLSGLQSLSQFLPGQPKSGLSLTFNGGKLTVRDVLALPTIPLGIGQIEGVALNLGMTASLFPPSLHFDLSLSTPDEPFHWLVSPLSGNGAIGFGAADQQHSVLVQGGIGVGLGVDFGIASGSASVCIALRVDQNVPPLEVTALLTGNAEVDVLDGLASASISLTAGVGLAVDTPAPSINIDPSQWLAFVENVTVTVSAEVAVGIHVSVCWLVHVDVDESWRFSETISPGDVLSIL